MKKIFVYSLAFMLLTTSFVTLSAISYQQPISQNTITSNTPIAHWKFDETSGNTAYDSSGNGYHGTVYGAQWTNGRVGGALKFDGDNDYVQITGNSDQFHENLQTVGKGSISLWFKCDYIPDVHGIAPMFYYGSLDPCNNMFDASNQGLIIELGHSPIHPGSKRLYFTIFADGCDYPSFCYDSWIPLHEGEWYHFVAVVGADYNTGYLNGVEMDDRHYNFGNSGYSQFFEDAVAHETSWIGKGYWDAKNTEDPKVFFDGIIDDVRIYDEPLTSEEVEDLYSMGDDDLVGHWKFDETSGDTAYDSSGNNFHASIVGDPLWVPGMGSAALFFDGINDYIDMPLDAVEYIGGLSKGTIVFWFRFVNTLQNQNIIPLFYIGIDNENDDDDLFIIEIGHGGTYNTRLYVTWIIDQQIPVLCYDSGFNLDENQWYHFAVVVGPDGNTGYLNGEELEDRHYNFGQASDDLFLDDIPVKEKLSVAYGKTNDMIDPYFRFFKGAMDDVRIYSRPLNDTEMWNLYIDNNAPFQPSDPDPGSGAINVEIDKTLSWTGGDPNNDTVTYDVYFGKDSNPPKVVENITEESYDPGILDYNSTYFWKIVAWDDMGYSTEGPIWYFRTKVEGNFAPEIPDISGPIHGKAGVEYDFTFVTTDVNGDDVYYWICWGDLCTTPEWIGPYASGEEAIISYTYEEKGTYTIEAKAKDIHDAESDWGYLEVTMSKSKVRSNVLQWIFSRFPNAFPVLRYILK
jgi:hypothetical protein